MLTYIYIICGVIMLFTIAITILICQWAYFIPRKKIKKINKEIDEEIYKNYLECISRGKKLSYWEGLDLAAGFISRKNKYNNLPTDEQIRENIINDIDRKIENLSRERKTMQPVIFIDKNFNILYTNYYKKNTLKHAKNKYDLVKNIEARFNDAPTA